MEYALKLLSEIPKYWHTWFGLLLAECCLFPFAWFLKEFSVSSWFNFILSLVLAIIIFVVWHLTNRTPKTHRDKIGFVVSIYCADKQSQNTIRDDFVLTLKRLIKSGSNGEHFQFIEIPRHISCNINSAAEAIKLQVKTRSHFVLYGRSRTRLINAKESHYIELDALVGHNPIPTSVQKRLSNEFSELLLKKIIINKENGLFEFEITSEFTELVAKYIMGMASGLSGDLNYAELLFEEVQSKLAAVSWSLSNPTPLIKLRERLPARLVEIREAKTEKILNEWFETYNDDLIDLLNIELLKFDQRSTSIVVLHAKAIYAFIKNRNVNDAIKLIKSCPNSSRGAVWHVNLAFLFAYKGNLRQSLQHYRNAEKLKIEILTLNQTEAFTTHILSIEPDKAQLYFCLGYINWKIKGDSLQAISDYRQFVDNVDAVEFSEQVTYANKWIDELSMMLAKPQ